MSNTRDSEEERLVHLLLQLGLGFRQLVVAHYVCIISCSAIMTMLKNQLLLRRRVRRVMPAHRCKYSFHVANPVWSEIKAACEKGWCYLLSIRT